MGAKKASRFARSVDCLVAVFCGGAQGLVRMAGLAATAGLLAGCDDPLATPTITDTTNRPWLAGPALEFTTEISIASGWKIDAVYVRYARHSWPGPQVAHVALASSDAAIPGGFKAAGPAAARRARDATGKLLAPEDLGSPYVDQRWHRIAVAGD